MIIIKLSQKKFQPLIVLVNSVYKELETKIEDEILNNNIPLKFFIKI